MIDPSDAIALFYYAYRACTSRPDAMLAERGLGRVHHRLLFFIGREPGIAVSALLERLMVSKQAVNAPLRQLTGSGLIAVSPDARDRRVRRLTLTDAGLALERQLTSAQAGQLAAAFAGTGPEAAAGWQQVMRQIAGRESP